MTRSLSIVLVAILTTLFVAQSEPPAQFAIDARPRMVRSTVDIYIFDANTAEGGIGVCDIVDVTGRVIEKLAHRVTKTSGEQIITVDASRWTNGLYLLYIKDNGSSGGCIKLLKVQ